MNNIEKYNYINDLGYKKHIIFSKRDDNKYDVLLYSLEYNPMYSTEIPCELLGKTVIDEEKKKEFFEYYIVTKVDN